ncbi:protein of unknown function [Magnetospirillum sp. XM-1]|nr:protein of unknown function [Magnetospirillum sp. XM-1]
MWTNASAIPAKHRFIFGRPKLRYQPHN